jgi:MFS family permease
VYDLSGSPLALGFIGLARFVPALAAAMVGGAIADTRDRRTVLMLAQLAPFAVSAVLLIQTMSRSVNLPLVYVLVVVLGLASSFENPARQALLPQLVSRETFAGAVTMLSTVGQFAFVLGPAIGGWTLAGPGPAGTYAVHLAIQAAAILTIAVLPVPHAAVRASGGLRIALVKEGLRFVRDRPVLLGVMGLDMFAVIFAGAQALLPIYARDILDAGPEGYGWLTSSQAVGGMAAAISMLLLPPVRHTGRVLLFCVLIFGVGTIVFGLSRWFPLSLAAYAITGAADQVGVVMRSTTIQLITPDELRGRVSSVNMVFIGASNQLGALESGLVASITNATFAVVTGGAGCLAALGLIWAKVPDLWRYDTRA